MNHWSKQPLVTIHLRRVWRWSSPPEDMITAYHNLSRNRDHLNLMWFAKYVVDVMKCLDGCISEFVVQKNNEPKAFKNMWNVLKHLKAISSSLNAKTNPDISWHYPMDFGSSTCKFAWQITGIVPIIMGPATPIFIGILISSGHHATALITLAVEVAAKSKNKPPPT